MKTYQRLLIDDGRPKDDWGLPVGPSYEEKKWDLLTPEEMKADFEWKSDILATQGEEVSGDTFYQDYLFHELYDGSISTDIYKVMLTEYDADAGSKVHRVDVDDIYKYLHLNDVALSPCLFHQNWRMKKLLNYVGAFVLDIDKLRPQNLERFFMLFESGRLLTPTFIANSGSGVHFYYVLDKMLKIDSVKNGANNLIAEEIYIRLYDDVINKEKWRDAQKHWLGQDYRVVNSKTKLNMKSQIFKIGEVYSIEQLIVHYGIKIDRKKSYATKDMIKYASNIARNLEISPPDFSNSKETYNFIEKHKDAAYQVREERRRKRAEKEQSRKKKSKAKPITWYRRTFDYMKDHTRPGYRFSSMKALAKIAQIEKVPRDVFMVDLAELGAYWESYDWKGDKFNPRNLEAIERFYDTADRYTVSSKTLEEWLGYEFRRIGVKRNGRKQSDHIKVMNMMKKFKKQIGESVNEGRPKGSGTAQQQVQEWRQAHPEGKKADCIRETGLSKPTVYKWW